MTCPVVLTVPTAVLPADAARFTSPKFRKTYSRYDLPLPMKHVKTNAFSVIFRKIY